MVCVSQRLGFSNRDRGASLVEFALVLPILLAVTLFLIDGSLILRNHLAVSRAHEKALLSLAGKKSLCRSNFEQTAAGELNAALGSEALRTTVSRTNMSGTVQAITVGTAALCGVQMTATVPLTCISCRAFFFPSAAATYQKTLFYPLENQSICSTFAGC